MNKNLLLIFASLFISLGLAAQNFTIVTTSTTYTGNPSQAIDALVKVTNISGNTIELIAERRMNNTAPSHESNFCWGPSCYSPFTSISTDTVFLAPGDEDNTFKGTLSPFGATGTSVVEYCFYEHTSPNDSICVTFTYLVESTSVGEIINEKTFSLPYPNPSNQMVMFSYDITRYNTGSVYIYNMLGSVIKEVNLTDKKSLLVIPVKELEPGVYFATLIADGNKVVTRKLIVSHK